MRSDAVYHCEACEKRHKRHKSTDKAPTRNRGRRRQRNGTDLYVVPDDLELVRSLLAGEPADLPDARARLERKVVRAFKRIGRKAA
jgi:hypothetical protein